MADLHDAERRGKGPFCPRQTAVAVGDRKERCRKVRGDKKGSLKPRCGYELRAISTPCGPSIVLLTLASEF